MRKLQLKERIVFKFLIVDLLLISAISFLSAFFLSTYKAVTISFWLIALTSPIVFLSSFWLASRIHNKVQKINDALEQQDLPASGMVSDELDQLYENVIRIRKKIFIDEYRKEKTAVDFRQLLDKFTTGSFVINNLGEIAFVNKAVKDIFGDSDFEGKEVLTAFQNNDLAILVEKGMMGKQSNSRVDIYYPKPKTLIVNVFPFSGKGSDIKGCMVLVDDLTALDKLEDIKKDLIANVSHDLRTPIATVKSLAEALKAGGFKDIETNKSFTEDIINQVDKIDELIRDLLDLSKLESGVKNKPRSIDVQKLLTGITADFKNRIEEKGLNLKIDFEKSLPSAQIDEEQIKKVFVNLLDNAVKFTQKGSISLNVFRNKDFVMIDILDTGVGIKQKDLDRIFDRFFVANKDRSSFPGTGLGLSIVKHALDANKGFVKVKSDFGKGTLFSVGLPVKERVTDIKGNKKEPVHG